MGQSPAPLPWRLQRPCACALIAPAQSSTCAEGLIFLAANASTPSPQACAASIPAALRQLGRDARWGWLRRAGARSRASRLAPKLVRSARWRAPRRRVRAGAAAAWPLFGHLVAEREWTTNNTSARPTGRSDTVAIRTRVNTAALFNNDCDQSTLDLRFVEVALPIFRNGQALALFDNDRQTSLKGV